MPRYIKIHSPFSKAAKVATEAELTEFANKLRAAGDADPIESLLPSTPGDSNSCLIANACNFKSQVFPVEGLDPDTGCSEKWVMKFPPNFPVAKRHKLAESVGCEILRLVRDYDETHSNVMLLPEHIGNAAEAFDCRKAFTKYAKEAN